MYSYIKSGDSLMSHLRDLGMQKEAASSIIRHGRRLWRKRGVDLSKGGYVRPQNAFEMEAQREHLLTSSLRTKKMKAKKILDHMEGKGEYIDNGWLDDDLVRHANIYIPGNTIEEVRKNAKAIYADPRVAKDSWHSAPNFKHKAEQAQYKSSGRYEGETLAEFKQRMLTEGKMIPKKHPKVEPVSSPKVEPVSSPKVEPVSSPKVEPVSSPKVEPVSSPKVEPTIQTPMSVNDKKGVDKQMDQVSKTIEDKVEALKPTGNGLKITAGILGGGLALGAYRNSKKDSEREKTSSYLYKIASKIRSNDDAALAFDTYNDPHVSPNERLKAYKEWREYTSKQDPKSKLKSALTGALGTGLLGAGIGGLVGASHKTTGQGVLIGSGVGALMGGLGGLSSAMNHNSRISDAKSKMHLNDADSMSYLERSTARARAMKARQRDAERQYDRAMNDMDRYDRMSMRRQLMDRSPSNINYSVRL